MFRIHSLKEYLNICNKTDKCTCMKYVLSHIINYQHVSIAFAIIIRVFLQQIVHLEPLIVIISLLTPWSRVLLEKLTSFQLVKKFPAFYGT